MKTLLTLFTLGVSAPFGAAGFLIGVLYHLTVIPFLIGFCVTRMAWDSLGKTKGVQNAN